MKWPGTLSALAAVAAVSSTLAIGAYCETAHAQTQGMERRGERRDTRHESREAKQACKAGDEKSRAECRQTKHETKQAGRHDQPAPSAATPAPKPPAS